MTLRTNSLALGTVQFGLSYGIANQQGQVTQSAANAILRRAATRCIDTLDTAIAYGESEQCLGQANVSAFKVVTKLPAVPADCPDVTQWIGRQMAASLERLHVEAVYGLLLHSPMQLLGEQGQEIFNALQGLKADGKVGKIGISVYAPTELELLIPRYRMDLVQAPFNLVDQRLHTSGWLEKLKAQGVEVHTRSAFLQGLLLMPQAAIPVGFSAWDGIWNKWHRWIAESHSRAVDACLAFPMRFPEIDRVVVGVDNVDQLDQIVDAASVAAPFVFPDLRCDDENLINPARWPKI